MRVPLILEAPPGQPKREYSHGNFNGTIQLTVCRWPRWLSFGSTRPTNRSPYAEWFNRLDAAAAAKILVALSRLERGNTSNVKSVGDGVSELKVDFGPGYRVYFGWDGSLLVILVGGGIKKRQNRDIEKARAHWTDYQSVKKQEQKRIARLCH